MRWIDCSFRGGEDGDGNANADGHADENGAQEHRSDPSELVFSVKEAKVSEEDVQQHTHFGSR